MNIVNLKVEELIPYINNPRNNIDAVDKVAALNTNRKFIGIELDEKYFDIAKKRLEEANQISFFNT